MSRWFAFEQRWRDVLVEAVAPAGPPSETGGMSAFWQELDEQAPAPVRRGLRLAVWAFTFSPIALVGRPRLLGTLPPSDRARCLQRAGEHRSPLLRELAGLVRLVVCVAWFRDGDGRRRIGVS